nr:branched-chain amino acid ABC transporter permease [uncultured Azospirillum sp.]
MSMLLVQALNGLQFGVLLFLVAAGLSLVFGVMDLINLAHGVQYMLGAYVAATLGVWTGSFWLGALLALPVALLVGLALEWLVFRHLYRRDHLSQVLATFGVILTVDEATRALWGSAPQTVLEPAGLTGGPMGGVEIVAGLIYPTYRLVIIGIGIVVPLLLWFLVERTRAGMLVRAGATHPAMVSALGVDIRRLFTVVFAFGAMLAGFAGALASPIFPVAPGMGDTVLILCFVVIVIGGVGSIRGAFIAALLVGLLDSVGRAMLPDLLRLLLDPSSARQTGAALASMLVYIVMAAILFFRPAGLFPGGRSA